MSDCEKPDFLCVACSGKRKRKEKSKLSCDNGTPIKAEENQKKRKKKSSKCKDAKTRGMGKKKERKKKKKKTVGEHLERGFLTVASVPVESSAAKMEPLQPDPVSRAGTSKRKKRVEFDLSPCGVRIKRPKHPASSPPCPTKSILSKSGGDQGPTQERNSQSNSQDINSQDLFITQKTFRAPSPETSSGETSDKAPVGIPSAFMQPGVLLSPRGCRESPKLYRSASKPRRKVEEELDKQKNWETMTQKTGIGSTLPTEVESSSPVCKISRSRSSKVELSVVPPSPEAAKSKKKFYIVSQKKLTSTATQTENFFTDELSSYLQFCRRRAVGPDAELLKPLDLTLWHNSRRAAGVSMDAQEKREEAGHKSKTILSLQSDSELKSADTTTSGEDNEPPGRPGDKSELVQVKAVQMRLNECFFFKTKGNGQSPRPQSPLMKLTLARGMTSRKCR